MAKAMSLFLFLISSVCIPAFRSVPFKFDFLSEIDCQKMPMRHFLSTVVPWPSYKSLTVKDLMAIAPDPSGAELANRMHYLSLRTRKCSASTWGRVRANGSSSNKLLPSKIPQHFADFNGDGLPPMKRQQKGFSVIELLIVVAILLIIAAIAIPNFFTSRRRANDAAAVSALHTLLTSEASYTSTYGQTAGYAGSLATLGPAPTCDQTHACLIDAQLGCATEPCVRGGFKYFSTTDSTSPPINDFTFSATPRVWQTTGSSNFCLTEDGVIRFEVDASSALAGAVTHDKCLNFAQYENI